MESGSDIRRQRGPSVLYAEYPIWQQESHRQKKPANSKFSLDKSRQTGTLLVQSESVTLSVDYLISSTQAGPHSLSGFFYGLNGYSFIGHPRSLFYLILPAKALRENRSLTTTDQTDSFAKVHPSSRCLSSERGTSYQRNRQQVLLREKFLLTFGAIANNITLVSR